MPLSSVFTSAGGAARVLIFSLEKGYAKSKISWVALSSICQMKQKKLFATSVPARASADRQHQAS